MAGSFEELIIWQKAHNLTLRIYDLSAKWPKAETYGLTSQIRRAAVSVELNIAEGHSRYHNNETIHFMYNSRGSAQEVRNCLFVARDLPEFDLGVDIFNLLNLEYIGLVKGINGFVSSKRKSKTGS